MKYSRTALGLLNAQYRSVLRKCFLINMGLFALGAVAATPANAYTVTADTNLNEQFPDGVISDGINYSDTDENSYNVTFTTPTIDISSTTGNAINAWWGSELAIGGEETSSVTLSGDRGLSVFDPNSKVTVNAINTVDITGNNRQGVILGNTGDTVDISANNISITGEISAVHADAGTTANVGTGSAAGNAITLSGAQIACTDTDNCSNAAVEALHSGIINIGNGTQDVSISGKEDITVWALANGSNININGKTVDISSTNGSAVWAQNNTTASTDPVATVDIKADTINISAPNDNGVVAMSQGIVNIEGDTTITAKDAILARGNAQVNVNTDSDSNKTVLNGDIVFDYSQDTSGTPINAYVNVNLNGADSSWTGNTYVDWDTKPTDETKLNVKNSSITLSDGATWNATKIENNEADTDGSRYTSINNLTVDGGNVNFKEADAQVQIDNLKVGADGVNVTKKADSDRIQVNTTADLRNGVSDNYADVINVNNNAKIYVDADASGNIDSVGHTGTVTVDNVTLLSALNEGATIKTAGYEVSNNAKDSLKAYYQTADVNGAGNIVLGAKQGYTDLIGIEQNGNYIKAFDAADAENTSVSANLSALDNQVFENETNIAQNTADIAANADAIAQNAAAIAGKLSGEEAADYTISGKRGSELAANIATYVAANGDKFADVQNTANIITDLFNDKAAYIQETTGMDPEHSVAYNYNQSSEELLHGATSMLNADEKLAGAIAKRKVTVDATTGIASITDGTNTANVYTKEAAEAIFNKKQQWVDDTLGIVSADADAVKKQYASTNYLKDATTLTGADKALDEALKANADKDGVQDTGLSNIMGVIGGTYAADTGSVTPNAIEVTGYTDSTVIGAINQLNKNFTNGTIDANFNTLSVGKKDAEGNSAFEVKRNGAFTAANGAFHVNNNGAITAANGEFHVNKNGDIDTVHDITASGDIYAEGDVYTEGDVYADGDVYASGTLSVADGAFEVNKNGAIRAAYDEDADKYNFFVNKNGAIKAAYDENTGDYNFITDKTGNVTAAGEVSAKTFANANDTFTVDENGNIVATSINANLVEGNTLAIHGESWLNNTHVDGALAVSKDASVGGNFAVAGTSYLHNTVVEGDMAVSGTTKTTALTFNGESYVAAMDQGDAAITNGTVDDQAKRTMATNATVAKTVGKLANLENTHGVTSVADVASAINSLATNVETATGGTFTNNVWKGTVTMAANPDYTYNGATGHANIMAFVNDLASNIGTATAAANGNIAKNKTVNANLDALDEAIGDRRNLGSANEAINQGTKTSVAAGLKAAGDAIGDMNFTGSHYVAGNNDLSGAVRSLDSNLYRVESDLRDLRRDFRRGMASMSAMSALVPNPRAHGNTSLAIGTGAYDGHTAAAIGGFHYLTDNIMLNAGVAWGNSSDAAYRMGVTFSW